MEQGSSKKNNIIVLCVVIAVIAVALVAYFVISGQKGDGSPTVSATMELNTVNIYGAWYKKAGDSTYELRFKDNKELSYKQTAADGTIRRGYIRYCRRKADTYNSCRRSDLQRHLHSKRKRKADVARD